MIKLPRPKANKTAIAPSILSANQLCLGQQITAVQKAGADWLHIDIMDGHFVPNLSFGPATVKAIDGNTNLAQDVHLMVQNPAQFIEPFTKAGASALTLHIEAKGNLPKLLKQIKKSGLAAGISIKPDTKPAALKPYLKLVDIILVMSVYPGFGGQGFLKNSPKQIAAVRQLINQSKRKIWLQVDGGINAQSAQTALKAGANALVAGHAIFGHKNIKKALNDIKRAANLI